MRKKLKIHADRQYLSPGVAPIPMLYPFWGKTPFKHSSWNSSGRRYGLAESKTFDAYIEAAATVFELSPLDEADIAVLPCEWGLKASDERLLGDFCELVREAGKRIAVFNWGDHLKTVPLDHAVVFCTHSHRSTQSGREFSVPAWSEDFLGEYCGDELPVREKRAMPTVGFCGFADNLNPSPRERLIKGLRLAKSRVSGLVGPPAEGVRFRPVRTEAMRRLCESRAVETNFLIRERYWGGAETPEAKHRARLEYVENMLDSDYALCARGAGNYSFRLYEALSLGRIPVFIDSDSVLPYDFALDWREYCVWVDQDDVSRIAERVREFHDRMSPQEFVERQAACRKLWEDWISPRGFFANFYRHFLPRISGIEKMDAQAR